jgi:tRNA-dihydrouridine synthase 1
MLAKSRAGDIDAYERILQVVERKVAEGLLEYERTDGASVAEPPREGEDLPEDESSAGTMARCRRPWWVAQPIIRPLPSEAMKKGAVRPKKKDQEKAASEREEKEKADDIKARDAAVAG